MSFLNKQKFHIGEKDSLFGKHEDKKATYTNPKKNEDIIGNVNSFREDLRKQITEKLKSSSKIIDVSSPKHPEGMKLYTTKASDNSLSNDLFKRPLTSKASEKKFDLVGELLHKKGTDSSAVKGAQKSGEYFTDLWEKKRDSQRVSIKSIDVNSFFGDNEKRTVSPFRDQAKSEFSSTGFLKKAERPTLADTKPGSRTPQQALKEDLNKIFEPFASRTPNAGKENKLKIDTDRSYKALSQEIAKFRSSRSNLLEQSPISRPKELTPKHSSQTAFFNDRERESEKDKPFSRFNFHSPSTTESIFFNREDSNPSGDKKLIDKFPLSKIYEIQDLFYNVSEKEFNDLSPEYVEELIKLSSVIMHRVKSSNYYTKS